MSNNDKKNFLGRFGLPRAGLFRNETFSAIFCTFPKLFTKSMYVESGPSHYWDISYHHIFAKAPP